MSKMIGGIFLIIGISIGVGILALPVTTSTSGFFWSSGMLLGCWLLMTFSAFLILEVNLWLPQNSNLISMARATLGKGGQLVAWFTYLFLFYALLSAYMAAGADILTNLLSAMSLQVDHFLGVVVFASILGFVVYRGPHSVDYVNRSLIVIKLGSFLVLMLLMASHVSMPNLLQGHPRYLLSTLMVIITAFGFAPLVPSLCNYFDRDVVKLRRVILLGSFVPLICYIVWIFVILGSLPLEGEHGLRHVLGSQQTTSALIDALQYATGSHWVVGASRLFSSISVATSFLGVAFVMTDFLTDGFNIPRQKLSGDLGVCALTLLPPMMIVLFYPGAFILALNYAGTCCMILLAILPVCMVWGGRYRRGIATGYRVYGEKKTLLLVLVVSLIVMSIGILQEFHLIPL